MLAVCAAAASPSATSAAVTPGGPTAKLRELLWWTLLVFAKVLVVHRLANALARRVAAAQTRRYVTRCFGATLICAHAVLHEYILVNVVKATFLANRCMSAGDGGGGKCELAAVACT
jgi:hypothetical protein